MASASSLPPPSLWLSLVLVTSTFFFFFFLDPVHADFDSERAECTNQLIGLSTCLSYVQGQSGAATPTPDCCAACRQVVSKSFKCLCLLVKERNNPQLGLKVDVGRALTLPSKCNSPANPKDCTKLLNLPPNSTDAKEFEEFGDELQGMSSTKNATLNSTVAGRDSMQPSGARSDMWPSLGRLSGLWLWFLLLL